MKKNYKILLIIFIGIVFITYFLINNTIGKGKLNSLKNLLNQNQKEFIKKYFFPHKIKSQQNETISQLDETISQLSQLDETISQQNETISQQNETIAKQDVTISQLDETISQLSQLDETISQLSQQNETISQLSQQNETISQQNETIAKQDVTISQQNETIAKQDVTISEKRAYLHKIELTFKKFLEDFSVKEIEIVKLSNNFTMTKYRFLEGFYAGINKDFPGSGYLDFHLNNLIALSSRGVLGYNSNINNNLIFKQIKNNIDSFIDIEQFKKGSWFSLKDLSVHNNIIFISYTEEIKKDCWNTSLIFSEINYQNIEFEKLFSSNKCIHSDENIDKEFSAHRSGGRIVGFNDNHIFLSIGEYNSRYLAQDKESINGKIIKINVKNSDYEIISMGHRNPQGLYYDVEKNFILETEHGPQGGDEINIIEFNKFNEDEIPNYGWAIVSTGEHYGGRTEDNKLKYKKYPLYNSHKQHGFVEPIKSFVSSIGISEITKIDNNYYVVSSLKDKSLYFFELNKENKIINLSRVEVFERVRDMIYKDKNLYLFLENTASLGIIDISSSL